MRKLLTKYNDSAGKLESGREHQSLINLESKWKFRHKSYKTWDISANKFLLSLTHAAIVTSVFSHDKCYIGECCLNDSGVSVSIHMENANLFFHTEVYTYPHPTSSQACVQQPTSPPSVGILPFSIFPRAILPILNTCRLHDTNMTWLIKCESHHAGSPYTGIERLNLCQVWE